MWGVRGVVNIADASDEEVSDTECVHVKRDARAAENIVRELAGRIGAEGGEVLAIVRCQRWSPINVHLMWAAQWLVRSTLLRGPRNLF